ncbi:MAG: AAA family ATPase [Rhodospirillaceae bacterium]|jgi:class 3 adenylate cyclase|nr:AAA family ATPase [Rhodospirillaceae bacterium]MBT5192588.1 AAA family ATPase [Rhodospirillaceae bacterium]MBT5898594.1 AAA family ATPase [Rhodospirillaceae bacterium]MBT6429127.1 AAA family ATPase [Rhodospirillaceae bacterium]MBT7756023.1 AAA family ATPase [Rhodospirillaceae bacterium]
MDDIRQWLEEIGLGGYADAFEENLITFDHLALLSNEDLKELGVIPIGHRKTFSSAVAKLNGNRDTAKIADTSRQSSSIVERRQLTVMFCDLVGSTALSRRLDPEDLRDVMQHYQDSAAAAVKRYGGHVAKYLGDGVLAYFGWPQAYEDQAERAVHAGLFAVNAINDIKVGGIDTLAARVGIATGQVVVGDLVGESGSDAEAVSGEAPNLAARLQQLAEPGDVIVGEATHRLVGQTFMADDLGTHDLKGFDNAVRAWRITGETMAESRFEAAHSAALTRLVGRETELRLLLERWQDAVENDGQIAFVSGEAGIGKSRLVQALCGEIREQHHFRLRFQCSPLHANSAFYPIIQRLQRAAEFTSDDSDADKLGKLETILRLRPEDTKTILPLFAALLSIPPGWSSPTELVHRYS